MSTHANDTKGHRVATTTADTAPAAASTCQWCGNQFRTHQGRNAHFQFCKEKPTNTATAAFGKTTSTATAIPKEVQDNLGPYRTSKSTTTKKNTTTAT